MSLKIRLDPTISNIELFNTARFMLNKFYEDNNFDSKYVDNIPVDDFIKSSYLNSMFDNLLNLCNAIGVSFPVDEMLVITNTIYRLKGLRESLEYFFKQVIKCDFTLTYDYVEFKWSASFDNLQIDNLTKFNIYLKRMVDELYYTKEYDSSVENISLKINIEKILSYGISQTYFNDFHLKQHIEE